MGQCLRTRGILIAIAPLLQEYGGEFRLTAFARIHPQTREYVCFFVDFYQTLGNSLYFTLFEYSEYPFNSSRRVLSSSAVRRMIMHVSTAGMIAHSEPISNGVASENMIAPT